MAKGDHYLHDKRKVTADGQAALESDDGIDPDIRPGNDEFFKQFVANQQEQNTMM